MNTNQIEMYSYSMLPVDEPFSAEQKEVLDSTNLELLKQVLTEAPVDEPFTAAEVVEIASGEFEAFILPQPADGPISSSEFAQLIADYSRNREQNQQGRRILARSSSMAAILVDSPLTDYLSVAHSVTVLVSVWVPLPVRTG